MSGTTVKVSMSDTTTGQTVTKTLHMSDPDTSSAEWIAEAPSAVEPRFGTQVLPLANFGRVAFSGATATPQGRPHGHNQRLQLERGAREPSVVGRPATAAVHGPRFASFATGGRPPRPRPGRAGSAFSVAYSG